MQMATIFNSKLAHVHSESTSRELGPRSWYGAEGSPSGPSVHRLQVVNGLRGAKHQPGGPVGPGWLEFYRGATAVSSRQIPAENDGIFKSEYLGGVSQPPHALR